MSGINQWSRSRAPAKSKPWVAYGLLASVIVAAGYGLAEYADAVVRTGSTSVVLQVLGLVFVVVTGILIAMLRVLLADNQNAAAQRP